jgi:hypothetical protein
MPENAHPQQDAVTAEIPVQNGKGDPSSRPRQYALVRHLGDGVVTNRIITQNVHCELRKLGRVSNLTRSSNDIAE